MSRHMDRITTVMKEEAILRTDIQICPLIFVLKPISSLYVSRISFCHSISCFSHLSQSLGLHANKKWLRRNATHPIQYIE